MCSTLHTTWADGELPVQAVAAAILAQRFRILSAGLGVDRSIDMQVSAKFDVAAASVGQAMIEITGCLAA